MKKIIIIILSVVIINKIVAQPNPGPGNQGSSTGTTSDGPQVPFDGGMSLLLLASGIGYTEKKLKQN